MSSWMERAIARILAGGRARPPRPNPLLALYRWRYEAGLVLLLTLGWLTVAEVGWIPPVAVLLVAVAVVVPWRSARRFVAARYWAVVVQHRLRIGFFEAGLVTFRGRRPAILWTTPRAAAVRVVISLPAGIETADVTRARGVLAAACFAPDVVVERHPRFSNLLVLEVLLRPVSVPPATT